MELLWQTAFSGLGEGAVIAGVALGLVLAFQGSGVVNFSHGAMMMYSTYLYDELRDTGDLVFPLSIAGRDRFNLLGVPPEDGVSSFWPAFLVALVLAALLGLVVHLFVFRPLRGAPVLAKVVATVGIFVTLQAIVLLRFGTQNETVGAVLPTDAVEFAGLRIPQDRLWLALIVVIAAAVLAAIYSLTNFGLATRAAAEQEKGAILLGYSPDALAMRNWVLASVVAAIFGILAASLSGGVNTVNYTLLVVPALAGALVGLFRSFWVAALSCLALGMARSSLSLYQSKEWWPDFARSGARDVVPFLIIVAMLFFRGARLPERGTLSTTRHAFAPQPRNIVPATAILVSLGLVAIFTFDRALRLSLYLSLTATILALSIVVLTGFVGQVSLAQAVFAGVAGFLVGKIAIETSIPFPVGPLLGALGAAVLGVLIGIPALRVRGVQLAVVTMALGVAVGTLIFSNRSFVGDTGALPIEPPTLFGVDLAANVGSDFNRPHYGVMALIVTALCALLVVNLRRSPTGRAFLAVRANERAAAAAGINVASNKLVAFGISSALAGLGGAMLAYLRGQLSGDSFSVFVSLALIAFAYLGGIGLVSGAITAGMLGPGGVVFGLMAKMFGGDRLDTYANLIGGLGLILTAVLNPDGIAGKVVRDTRAKRTRPQHAKIEQEQRLETA